MRFPVSSSQQRLWFIDQLTPGEVTYNMPYAMWLDGPLDAAALQRAMDAMAARQAVLRTAIVTFDGLPEQVVADTGTVRIEHLELPGDLDDAERTRRAEAIAAERACQPFDLTAAPLMRATLIGAGPDRHLLALVMHHIISDGASMQVIIDELSALYRAEVSGEPVSLPELWLQYGDYAVWQQDRIRGEELERQLDHWRRQLRGAPQVLALPTDRPRPARQSARGGIAQATVDAATTRRLADVARGANSTVFMTFLTGFAAVLSRYARAEDLIVGTQVAGRTHQELDPLIGMFINTAALRIGLDGDPTFAELLARIRDITVDAMSHQTLPFEKLVEDLAPERTLSYAPLTQVQFLYRSLTPPVLDLPGVTATTRALFTGTAKLDLTMYADDGAGKSTTLTLEYSADLFDHAWAARFLDCMVQLLTHAGQAPATPVADLRLLSEAESDALARGQASPALAPAPGPADGGPVDVLALLRASTSQVIDGEQALPMSEVRDRAARIARVLAGHGVGTDTLVGLCVGRGIGMLSALLGVWWAGGAYVPLDPGFPEGRLAAMARGAGLQIIISDAEHAGLAKAVSADATIIGVDDPEMTSAAPLDPQAAPDDALAYVIFTSGSTGQPKGVGIEHRAIANLAGSFRHSLGLTGEDRFVAVTTLSFDIAILELLLPLACGADLVIATSAQTREPDQLRALIERSAATAMQATPQTWRLLEWPAGCRWACGCGCAAARHCRPTSPTSSPPPTSSCGTSTARPRPRCGRRPASSPAERTPL